MSLAVLVGCPGLAFLAMLLLGSDGVLERLERWIDEWPWRIIAVPVGLWLLYLAYAAGVSQAAIKAGSAMAAYFGLPFVVMWPSRKTQSRGWLEPLVILWIWLPLEFGIIRRILIAGAPGADLHYAFAQLLAIDTGIIAFAVWNRTPNIASPGLRGAINGCVIVPTAEARTRPPKNEKIRSVQPSGRTRCSPSPSDGTLDQKHSTCFDRRAAGVVSRYTPTFTNYIGSGRDCR